MGFELDLSNWPQWAPGFEPNPCWFGPSHIWHNRESTTVVRAMFSLILGCDMHPSWRVNRICCEPNCRNPHHHRLQAHNTVRAPYSPLPPQYYAIEAREVGQAQPDEESDLEMCDESIVSIEAWDATPEELHERFTGMFSLDTIAQALTRIRERRT